MAYLADGKPLKLTDFARMKAQGEKIAVVTCYDSSFAALEERAGVEILMIGDSLGNVLQGQKTTLPVKLEHIEYHTECVARGANLAFIISDLPFGSYQESPAQAMRSAARLMAAGAHMVKLEGGQYMAETVRFLVERGIPVCAHIGLTPQSVHQLGGYRVQGRDEKRGGAPEGRSARAGRRWRRHDGAGNDAGYFGRGDHGGSENHGDDRHRRGKRLRRPGSGAARHDRRVRQEPEVFEEFYDGGGEHRGCSAGVCGGGEGRDVSGGGAQLLKRRQLGHKDCSRLLCPWRAKVALREAKGRMRGSAKRTAMVVAAL